MFAQVRRCLPLSQRKLLIWRKRLRIWFCKLQLISLQCCRGNTKSFRSLQFVYLEFSRTLVKLDSFPLFHPFYLMSKLVRLLEGSLVLEGRQIQRSHSRLRSNRNTSSCKRRQRRQQRQSRRSVRWPGRQDLLGKSISTQTEEEAQWLRLEFVCCCELLPLLTFFSFEYFGHSLCKYDAGFDLMATRRHCCTPSSPTSAAHHRSRQKISEAAGKWETFRWSPFLGEQLVDPRVQPPGSLPSGNLPTPTQLWVKLRYPVYTQNQLFT